MPISVAAVSVHSSLLARMSYEADRTMLHLEFRDGSRYRYFGVPRAMYEGLCVAPSKGAYFNRQIRGTFPYELLTRAG